MPAPLLCPHAPTARTSCWQPCVRHHLQQRRHMAGHLPCCSGTETVPHLRLQEKAQLKAQQQQVEAAREARRGKMHVTIDLLGRQVGSDLFCGPHGPCQCCVWLIQHAEISPAQYRFTRPLAGYAMHSAICALLESVCRLARHLQSGRLLMQHAASEPHTGYKVAVTVAGSSQVLMANEGGGKAEAGPSDQPGPGSQPAPHSGARIQHQAPSSSDFFRVRPCAAPGAFVPSYVSSKPPNPEPDARDKAAKTQASQQPGAQQGSPPQVKHRRPGKAKSKKGPRSHSVVQHDDPMEDITAGTLAI